MKNNSKQKIVCLCAFFSVCVSLLTRGSRAHYDHSFEAFVNGAQKIKTHISRSCFSYDTHSVQLNRQRNKRNENRNSPIDCCFSRRPPTVIQWFITRWISCENGLGLFSCFLLCFCSLLCVNRNAFHLAVQVCLSAWNCCIFSFVILKMKIEKKDNRWNAFSNWVIYVRDILSKWCHNFLFSYFLIVFISFIFCFYSSSSSSSNGTHWSN